VPNGAAAGFQWWGPHTRARRSAVLLLAGVAAICAAYVMIGVGAIVLAIRIVQVGSEHSDMWPLGPVATAALVVALIIVLAAVIAVVASETLAARSIRLAGARPLTDAEAAHATFRAETFALGVGFPPPAVWVVDDPVPNAFAAGRRRACAVCLTTGALELPHDQLDALCAQTITSVANRALPLTCAAADLLVVARRCTNAIWAVVGVLLVATVIGVPPLFAAALTVAIVLVVVCSVPLLVVAERATRRLRNRSAQLADLDSVSVTNQPAALARVLLAAAADTRTVASRWEIAHLWFDPDTTRPASRGWELQFQSWLGDFAGDGTSREPAVRARRALLDRARVIVDLTSADPTLRRELDRAESA